MTYLNTGWAGPSPTRVIERMRTVAQQESDAGPAGPDGRELARAVEEEAREAAGALLNVPADDIVLTHGTTEGVNIVVSGLSWQPGDELLTTDLEHPAIKTPATLLAERQGVIVRPVAMPADATPEQAVEAVAQALTPRTKLVALSHIMFTTGLRIPAKETVQAAHDAGALVLLDGAQTGGQMILDVPAIGADFYTISGQKWLLGPTGSGALYMSPAGRERVSPLFTSPGQGSRTGLAGYALTSQSTPIRAGFAEALHTNWELGRESVEARIMDLASRLRAGLLDIKGVSISGPSAGTGLTVVSVDGHEPAAMVEAMWASERIVARTVAYPAGVRFCTAPFNNEADVDRAIEAMRRLAR
jgi:selenocysteine lyase/cysteine desulfurase